MFCQLAEWIWTAESAQAQVFWYSCSPHSSSATVHPEEASLPAVPITATSGWSPLNTDSHRAGLPPHLTFPQQVCKLFHAGKNANSSVSSNLCLRTENKQHNLLFRWENTLMSTSFLILLPVCWGPVVVVSLYQEIGTTTTLRCGGFVCFPSKIPVLQD